VETLSDTVGRIETREGANKVENAKEAATADGEFFKGEIEQSEADPREERTNSAGTALAHTRGLEHENRRISIRRYQP